MSLIQYTSDEMFSATDLVRKNKYIFDKISAKEIEKAVILRDGKPSAIIFDFLEYEKIMKEYLSLKAKYSTNQNRNIKEPQEKIAEEQKSDKEKSDEKISNDDFEAALKEIEKLPTNIEFSFDKEEATQKEKQLGDFWEK
jgi:hypothetical protein